MRLLLILLFHPTYLVKSSKNVSVFWIHLSVAGFAVMAGTAFQHLYPRLLNRVPWLGFFRKFSPANWNPVFDFDLFIRGAAMAGILLGTYFIGYVLCSPLAAGRERSAKVCYLAALSTGIPFLISCAVGFFFYHLDKSLGLLPVFGLFASTSLLAVLLRDLFGIHRAIIVYLAPTLLSLQLYGCFLLLP